jgi:hypothetical protein
MTPNDPSRTAVEPAPPGQSALDAATASLREHVDDRWVEISDRVLSKALTTTRRSLPVQAHTDLGPVLVSEQVLVAYVRAAIAVVDGATPTDIIISADLSHRYTGLTIEVTAEYGQPLLPIADRIRNLAEATLTELLGGVIPAVTVTAMHVHVADVSRADPDTGTHPS